MDITELREAIRSAFRGKPVSRVDLFGSAARGEMTPESDVDILVTPKPEATRRDLFIMAADVEDAVGKGVDFLIHADVEAMKNREARFLFMSAEEKLRWRSATVTYPAWAARAEESVSANHSSDSAASPASDSAYQGTSSRILDDSRFGNFGPPAKRWRRAPP